MEKTISGNWAHTLGEKSFMQEFWSDLTHFASQLAWFDYVALAIIIIITITSIQRGFALMLIRFVWYVTGIIIAGMLYTDLAATKALDWLGGNVDFNSFALIFLVFLLSKLLLYKLLEKIAGLHGPCPVNRFLAIVIGIALALGVAWLAADNVSQVTIFNQLVSHDNTRFFVSYGIALSLVLISSFVLIKMLNVKVGMDRPCPLLLALKPLDSILSAKNINSKTNHLLGVFMGGLFSPIVLVLLMIVLNHTNNIEATGYLANELQPVVNNTQNVLATYLNFITKI